jgi:ABC-type glycerol-3-phosphate transport system substrate-binding protein
MRTARRLVLATLVVALVAAGCGGDDDDDGGGGDAGTTTTEASTTTSVDEQAAEQEIKQNVEALFNAALPIQERVAYLEDGEQLRDVVEQTYQILGEQASTASAQVDEVTVNDDGTATVEFQVLLAGNPVLPTTGTAVLVDDKWLVSKATVCDLITLAGTTPDVCADIASGES